MVEVFEDGAYVSHPMEEHVKKAADLFDAYSTVVPLDGWATTDLVSLSNWIDVELQERGELEAPAFEQS